MALRRQQGMAVGTKEPVLVWKCWIRSLIVWFCVLFHLRKLSGKGTCKVG